MPKRPPEFYWLPTQDAQGSCYHAKVCNAHNLTPKRREIAIQRIEEEDLDPCSHCMEHHGLEPVVVADGGRTDHRDCPACGGNQTERLDLEFLATTVEETRACGSCPAEFVNTYRMMDTEIISPDELQREGTDGFVTASELEDDT